MPYSLNLAAETRAPATGSLGTKQGTGNREQGTGNREQGTGNREQAGRQGTMKYYYSRALFTGFRRLQPLGLPEADKLEAPKGYLESHTP